MTPSRYRRGLSASPHTPLAPPVYDIARHRYGPPNWWALCPSPVLHHDVHQAPRAPLPSSGVTWRGVAHRLPRRALPLLLCSYGLMRQTKSLPPARFPLPMGLCRLLPAPAGRWSFPTLSLRVFPWMPGPVPRRLVEMLSPVTSLHDIGLPPVGPGSALEKVRSATSERQ